MNTLILFDIDRTLMESRLKPSTYKQAFTFAIKQVYGLSTEVDRIHHYNMTDKQILFELLKLYGLDENQVKARMDECTKVMVGYFRENVPPDEFQVLPGARQLLLKLEEKDALLGVETGNLEPIAWQKLELTGLKGFFSFGGFGSDGPSRTEVVRIALKRAEKFGFKRGRVFLVGDTTMDVQAGKAAKARVIAVATGKTSYEDLEKAGADYVLENLEDTTKVVSLLLGE